MLSLLCHFIINHINDTINISQKNGLIGVKNTLPHDMNLHQLTKTFVFKNCVCDCTQPSPMTKDHRNFKVAKPHVYWIERLKAHKCPIWKQVKQDRQKYCAIIGPYSQGGGSTGGIGWQNPPPPSILIFI